MKKKTVNFTIEENEGSQFTEEAKIKFGHKKISEQSALSSNRSKIPKNNSKFSHQSKYNDSNWTNKSVVSIKFEDSDNGKVRSKHSLRSNESILNG
jgi:hypothetical protein